MFICEHTVSDRFQEFYYSGMSIGTNNIYFEVFKRKIKKIKTTN